MNLVPIKVKIGIDPKTGYAKYPSFNDLDSSVREDMDWSAFVDARGLGWHYDRCCDHKTDTPESPYGQQFGVLVVPKGFADAALSKFSEEVSVLDEAELADFYDNHAHKHEPDEIVDDLALKPYETKERLGVALTTEEVALRLKALDPLDDTPGIRKNKQKKWEDFKRVVGVEIIK